MRSLIKQQNSRYHPLSRDTPPSSSRLSGVGFVGVLVDIRRFIRWWCAIANSNYELVYIFVGSILLHDHVLRIIAGSTVGIIGVVYVILEYIPSIEPPQNMRCAFTV